MIRRCRPLLGTFVEITADATHAVEGGFAAIARIHELMSAHEQASELSRINRIAHREPVEVSAETREVLERSLSWWRMSDGVFDIVAAGARSLADGRIPRHSEECDPVETDSSALIIEDGQVRLAAPACVDLGGIAKGYAVDRAVAAMRSGGASRGLVNAGGDLFGFGHEPWSVAVVDPQTRVPLVDVDLRDKALATSAWIDSSAAHLPGRSPWTSVTVRAPNACDSDALTKIVWSTPSNVSELLAWAGASAFGIRLDGVVEEIRQRAIAA
jgi:thiamine biosynthesis lipoprotein